MFNFSSLYSIRLFFPSSISSQVAALYFPVKKNDPSPFVPNYISSSSGAVPSLVSASAVSPRFSFYGASSGATSSSTTAPLFSNNFLVSEREDSPASFSTSTPTGFFSQPSGIPILGCDPAIGMSSWRTSTMMASACASTGARFDTYDTFCEALRGWLEVGAFGGVVDQEKGAVSRHDIDEATYQQISVILG